ncbi:MAG: esterase-like activity of phytase family protein [Proteobacteria bacterium]|nr:esterase-like activity of phytase family protein [Pseudomonadota bacterium]
MIPQGNAATRGSILTGTVLSLLMAASNVSADAIGVSVEPIPLIPTATEEFSNNSLPQKVGALTYRGGFVLRSRDPRFGGFSGLLVSQDGRRLTAVSDDGILLNARLSYDRLGWMTNVSEAELTPLVSVAGRPLGYKRVRDAEALAADPAGNLIVAFEHDHRLWRYRAGLPKLIPGPKDIAAQPTNRGLEALTRLVDGRLLAVSEGLRTKSPTGGFQGWLLPTDGNRWDSIEIVAHRRYRPTGAATLPNGDVILLERWFSRLAGFSTRIRRIPISQIRPGTRLAGTEIAVIDSPMNVDNFEGIAARQAEDGKTILYLLSDDNFNGLQRTLLMMFQISE